MCTTHASYLSTRQDTPCGTSDCRESLRFLSPTHPVHITNSNIQHQQHSNIYLLINWTTSPTFSHQFSNATIAVTYQCTSVKCNSDSATRFLLFSISQDAASYLAMATFSYVAMRMWQWRFSPVIPAETLHSTWQKIITYNLIVLSQSCTSQQTQCRTDDICVQHQFTADTAVFSFHDGCGGSCYIAIYAR